MKSMKSMMMGGAILLALAMCLTSCEGTLDDVFGEWSRPTGNNSKQGDSSTTNATAITLDQTMKVLVKGGDALTITATVTPSEATFTWESSDEAVATVNNGVVTPKGVGITTITAKSGDLTATCEVFVGTEVNVSSGNPIQDYDILAGTQNTSAITIPAGCHVAFNGVNTNQGIVCSGDATIYLIDGKTNTVSAAADEAGIKIGGTGTTLTINAETEGTGILNATGGENAAGIGTGNGTDSNVTGGDITINGGVINATGSYAYVTGGAGIGTGGARATTGSTSNKCGAITINGGTVTANGAQRAAGIGTGTSYSSGIASNNTCGAITIGTGITSIAAIKGDGANRIIGRGPGMGHSAATTNCGTASVFDGSAWSPSDPLAAGTYGGLNLAISGNTWTLTPSN